MIRRATTIEYRGIAEGGRNEPLKVVAETEAGEELELYLKPSGRPELGVEGIANELFAACIAGQLALPVCEPVLVDLDPDWIDALPSAGLQRVLRTGSPVAFGSVAAGDGFKLWSAGDQILGARRQTALGIFVFDAFTGNDDRGLQKPNLLVRGDEMRMIDHELCFRLRMKIAPRVTPWTPGNLSSLVHAQRHILGPLLKGDRFTDIDAVQAGWAGLSDECLQDYEAALPPEWSEATGAIRDAVEHLRIVRDRIGECLDEVRRVLA